MIKTKQRPKKVKFRMPTRVDDDLNIEEQMNMLLLD